MKITELHRAAGYDQVRGGPPGAFHIMLVDGVVSFLLAAPPPNT